MGDSLSEQDREWVRAIVESAATRVFGMAKDQMSLKIRQHVNACPVVAKGKAMLVGMMFAASIGGGGFVVVIKNLLEHLSKIE